MPFFGGGGEYKIVGTNIKGGTDAAPAVIGDNNMALGNGALESLINGDGNIVIGNSALNLRDGHNKNVVIGFGALDSTLVPVENSVVIGFHDSCRVNPTDSVLMGYNVGAYVEGDYEGDDECVAMNGRNFNGSVAIGREAGATSAETVFYSVMIGHRANADINGVSIGSLSKAGNDSVSIGYSAHGDGINTVIIGTPAGAIMANHAVLIGNGTYGGELSTAVGHNAQSGVGGIALGADAIAGDNEIVIGQGSETVARIGAYDLASLPPGGKSVPYVLAQWGVPSGIAPSGVIGNNGALTLGTALPRTYSGGIYLYFPANAIFAGSVASSYWVVMSSTTAGTIYNNALSGIPAYVSAPTAFVTTGPGAYVATTGVAIVLGGVTVPANAMGPNGSIKILNLITFNNSASTKNIRIRFGGNTVLDRSVSTAVAAGAEKHICNSGVMNRQVSSSPFDPGYIGSSTNEAKFMSVNTSVNVTLDQVVQLNVATDCLVQEQFLITVQYGP